MPNQKAGKFGTALLAKKLPFQYIYLFQYHEIVKREQRLTLLSTFRASRRADLLAFGFLGAAPASF
jgi:hypothetical protein